MSRSDLKDRTGVRSYPRLRTRRLILREFAQDIPRMTLLIPHPCEVGLAEEWIASVHSAYVAGEWRAAQGFCRGRA
jgi:hypothetical protein